MNIAILALRRLHRARRRRPLRGAQPPARRRGHVRRGRARPGAHRQRHARRSSPTPRSTRCPRPTSLVVPGGLGTRALLERRARCSAGCAPCTRPSTWTDVGVHRLAAARRRGAARRACEATTHWAALRHARRARRDARRASASSSDGKFVTAAGVSAGIDMALTLAARIAGDDVAQAIQLGIEYDPQPPFDCGSPAKAGPEMTALLRGIVDQGERGRGSCGSRPRRPHTRRPGAGTITALTKAAANGPMGAETSRTPGYMPGSGTFWPARDRHAGPVPLFGDRLRRPSVRRRTGRPQPRGQQLADLLRLGDTQREHDRRVDPEAERDRRPTDAICAMHRAAQRLVEPAPDAVRDARHHRRRNGDLGPGDQRLATLDPAELAAQHVRLAEHEPEVPDDRAEHEPGDPERPVEEQAHRAVDPRRCRLRGAS